MRCVAAKVVITVIFSQWMGKKLETIKIILVASIFEDRGPLGFALVLAE